MDRFPIYRALIQPDLKAGIPAWLFSIIWLGGLAVMIGAGQYYFAVICLFVHILSRMLVRYVDVYFFDVIAAYLIEDRGILK